MSEAIIGLPVKVEAAPQMPERQFEANLRFLEESGEVGAALEPFYRLAVRREPSLADVRLRGTQMEGDKPAFAAVRPAWATKSGRHEVGIGNSEQTMARVGEYIEEFDKSNELLAKILGIPIEEFTAQKLLEFWFAHELGHAVLYEHYKAKPDDYRRMLGKEKAKLPIPHKSAKFLTTEEGRAYVDNNWEAISSRLGVASFRQLQDLHETKYRQMKQEKFADSFAARIMTGHKKRAGILGKLAYRA